MRTTALGALLGLSLVACGDSDDPSGAGGTGGASTSSTSSTGAGGGPGAGGGTSSSTSSGAGGEGGGDRTLEPGQCHDMTECQEFETCSLPESPLVCGEGPACEDEAGTNCPDGWTCGPPCDCGGPGCWIYCKAPCAEAGCPEGEACGGDGRACAPLACDDATPCPERFACEGGACAPAPCTSDAACGDAGFCVNGLCRSEPGICEALSA